MKFSKLHQLNGIFIEIKPGLVGHCISINPYYLVYKAKKSNYTPKLNLS